MLILSEKRLIYQKNGFSDRKIIFLQYHDVKGRVNRKAGDLAGPPIFLSF